MLTSSFSSYPANTVDQTPGIRLSTRTHHREALSPHSFPEIWAFFF